MSEEFVAELEEFGQLRGVVPADVDRCGAVGSHRGCPPVDAGADRADAAA
jgi:hypothetical protein